PACRGKCLPVLGWMLQGLCIEPPLNSNCLSRAIYNPEILYENQWFCVVNKPSGMLSVPGKSKAISVQQWLEDKYGPDRTVRMAHRLDQDTSGLLIAAFGQLSFKVIQSLFATRRVKKTYIAELEGNYESYNIPRQGRIELPLSPDWLDRPRQRIDFDNGKAAVTDYEFIGISTGRSRIMFHPLTGRTHQLRVHAASEMGLGIPIAGDRLYGKNTGDGSERLHLHAQRLEFTFPIDGQRYCFESPVPF
ncbi:MAG: RluA family pseudouridine synthase, partial [Muribaculaceae bacterium]|nr:RluA family pseudouridine synthase [Muribaculaceae bacterium]